MATLGPKNKRRRFRGSGSVFKNAGGCHVHPYRDVCKETPATAGGGHQCQRKPGACGLHSLRLDRVSTRSPAPALVRAGQAGNAPRVGVGSRSRTARPAACSLSPRPPGLLLPCGRSGFRHG